MILTCLDGFKEPINCFARTIFVPPIVTTGTDLRHVRNLGTVVEFDQEQVA